MFPTWFRRLDIHKPFTTPCFPHHLIFKSFVQVCTIIFYIMTTATFSKKCNTPCWNKNEGVPRSRLTYTLALPSNLSVERGCEGLSGCHGQNVPGGRAMEININNSEGCEEFYFLLAYINSSNYKEKINRI